MPANDPPTTRCSTPYARSRRAPIDARADERALRRARVVLLDTGARQGGLEWLKVLWSRRSPRSS